MKIYIITFYDDLGKECDDSVNYKYAFKTKKAAIKKANKIVEINRRYYDIQQKIYEGRANREDYAEELEKLDKESEGIPNEHYFIEDYELLEEE